MTANEEPGVSSMGDAGASAPPPGADPPATEPSGVAPRPRRRRLAALVSLALVAALSTAGYLGWRAGWWERMTGQAAPAPATPSGTPDGSPAAGVVVPQAAATAPVAAALAEGAALRPARVRAALTADLADPALGEHVVVQVAALSAPGQGVRFGGPTMIPASTTKLLTTTAALATLGPDHVFHTTVVAGARRGEVVLVGGGDPYLMRRPLRPREESEVYPDRADLVDLAAQTASALRAQGIRRVRLGYDAGLFTGPAFAPGWEADYATDGVVAPIAALWVDEGRPASGLGRVADPAAHAADLFGQRLADQGLRVIGPPRAVSALPGAAELARVDSPPLAQIVERVLDVSDNEAAEVLGHQVGLATGSGASFAGGVRGVTTTLRGLGVPLAGVRLHDASGLSRVNQMTPEALVAVLRLAADPAHPELRPVLTGLPVARFTGSLAARFEEPAAAAARGEVRAKTGTLTGVSGLAGVVVDAGGTPLVFVLAADRIAVEDTLAARAALDRLSADLARCRCSG